MAFFEGFFCGAHNASYGMRVTVFLGQSRRSATLSFKGATTSCTNLVPAQELAVHRTVYIKQVNFVKANFVKVNFVKLSHLVSRSSMLKTMHTRTDTQNKGQKVLQKRSFQTDLKQKRAAKLSIHRIRIQVLSRSRCAVDQVHSDGDVFGGCALSLYVLAPSSRTSSLPRLRVVGSRKAGSRSLRGPAALRTLNRGLPCCLCTFVEHARASGSSLGPL